MRRYSQKADQATHRWQVPLSRSHQQSAFENHSQPVLPWLSGEYYNYSDVEARCQKRPSSVQGFPHCQDKLLHHEDGRTVFHCPVVYKPSPSRHSKNFFSTSSLKPRQRISLPVEASQQAVNLLHQDITHARHIVNPASEVINCCRKDCSTCDYGLGVSHGEITGNNHNVYSSNHTTSKTDSSLGHFDSDGIRTYVKQQSVCHSRNNWNETTKGTNSKRYHSTSRCIARNKTQQVKSKLQNSTSRYNEISRYGSVSSRISDSGYYEISSTDLEHTGNNDNIVCSAIGMKPFHHAPGVSLSGDLTATPFHHYDPVEQCSDIPVSEQGLAEETFEEAFRECEDDFIDSVFDEEQIDTISLCEVEGSDVPNVEEDFYHPGTVKLVSSDIMQGHAILQACRFDVRQPELTGQMREGVTYQSSGSSTQSTEMELEATDTSASAERDVLQTSCSENTSFSEADQSSMPKTPRSQKKRLKISNWIIKTEPKYRCVYVEGIRHGKLVSSPPIAFRHTSTLLHTSTGSVCVLQGKMNKNLAEHKGLPKKLMAKFESGFPVDWKELVEDYLDLPTCNSEVEPAVGNTTAKINLGSSTSNKTEQMKFHSCNNTKDTVKKGKLGSERKRNSLAWTNKRHHERKNCTDGHYNHRHNETNLRISRKHGVEERNKRERISANEKETNKACTKLSHGGVKRDKTKIVHDLFDKKCKAVRMGNNKGKYKCENQSGRGHSRQTGVKQAVSSNMHKDDSMSDYNRKQVALTPGGEMVELSHLRRTSSGRLSKPPLHWWIGQHVVEQGGDITVHTRTQCASNFLEDIKDCYLSASRQPKLWKHGDKERSTPCIKKEVSTCIDTHGVTDESNSKQTMDSVSNRVICTDGDAKPMQKHISKSGGPKMQRACGRREQKIECNLTERNGKPKADGGQPSDHTNLQKQTMDEENIVAKPIIVTERVNFDDGENGCFGQNQNNVDENENWIGSTMQQDLSACKVQFCSDEQMSCSRKRNVYGKGEHDLVKQNIGDENGTNEQSVFAKYRKVNCLKKIKPYTQEVETSKKETLTKQTTCIVKLEVLEDMAMMKLRNGKKSKIIKSNFTKADEAQNNRIFNHRFAKQRRNPTKNPQDLQLGQKVRYMTRLQNKNDSKS